MATRGIPKGLRWFLFVIGVGALIACGIYIGASSGGPAGGWRLLRAMMFLLLGLFFILMYGENRPGESTGSNVGRVDT